MSVMGCVHFSVAFGEGMHTVLTFCTQKSTARMKSSCDASALTEVLLIQRLAYWVQVLNKEA